MAATRGRSCRRRTRLIWFGLLAGLLIPRAAPAWQSVTLHGLTRDVDRMLWDLRMLRMQMRVDRPLDAGDGPIPLLDAEDLVRAARDRGLGHRVPPVLAASGARPCAVPAVRFNGRPPFRARGPAAVVLQRALAEEIDRWVENRAPYQWGARRDLSNLYRKADCSKFCHDVIFVVSGGLRGHGYSIGLSTRKIRAKAHRGGYLLPHAGPGGATLEPYDMLLRETRSGSNHIVFYLQPLGPGRHRIAHASSRKRRVLEEDVTDAHLRGYIQVIRLFLWDQ